jgi:hypothetical protein
MHAMTNVPVINNLLGSKEAAQQNYKTQPSAGN